MHHNSEIVRLRPAKNLVGPGVSYHFLHEQEPDAHGQLQRVNTIFLTGKECAFKCLMCDLWKNTLDGPTPAGAILNQLDYTLARLPEADTIKLYNSSNFFDPKAVPPEDYPGIIERVKSYKRVIVENHPKLCGEACVEFSRQLDGKLEIAMGLETVHPEVLPLLNKQMTIEDFAAAASYLRDNEIDVRAFVLLNPPYLTGRDENIKWAFATVKFAFESGAQCCSIIPTRPGNGIMDVLQREHNYVPPTLDMLEAVFEQALSLKKGLVLADTWDIGFLSQCDQCFDARKKRLGTMNFDQQIHPKVNCNCHPIYA
jgi:radical SAM enzyme (TIGR01210 family)